jgi:hypothetical protein
LFSKKLLTLPPPSARIQFVDQTPELDNYFPQDDHAEHPDVALAENSAPGQRSPTTSPKIDREPSVNLPDAPLAAERVSPVPSSTIRNTDVLVPSQKRRNRNENTSDFYIRSGRSNSSPTDQPIQSPLLGQVSSAQGLVSAQGKSPQFSIPINSTQAVEAEYRRLADSAAASIPSVSSGLLLPEVWKQKFFWPNAYTTNQCTCLMRFYVEKLAPWVRLSSFIALIKVIGADHLSSSM